MSVRPAAVAGRFYPADEHDIRDFISHALSACAQEINHPKALIVPHAGYIYSGFTAAHAYATLNAKLVRRVVLLGPAHRVPFHGMALPDANSFETPLGEVKLDKSGMSDLLALPDVCIHDAAHTMEHSLEVQLPFLQEVLTDFTLIPVCVGAVGASSVADALDCLWGAEDTLIVISSDLSHFHPYDMARVIDQQSIRKVLSMDTPLSHEEACGATPINGLLEICKQRLLEPHLLDYRNSGDTAGDKLRVVGYTSIAFTEPDHTSEPAHRENNNE